MPAQSPARQKVEASIAGYFSRVEAHIAQLSAKDAAAYLDQQITRWTTDLTTFIGIVNSGRTIPQQWSGADAVDFHKTLGRLSTLKSALMVAA